MKQIKKLGGISPDRSGFPELRELGRDMRALGIRGVVWSNGKGRGADELFADLDPDLQVQCEAVSGTNHPLIDGLTHDLDMVRAHRDRYGKADTSDLPDWVRAYIEELETDNMTLRARVEELSPESGQLPDVAEFSPEVIRQARECLGWTQETAARMLGASVPTLNRWEHGKTIPASPSHIRAIGNMVDGALDAGLEVVSVPF